MNEESSSNSNINNKSKSSLLRGYFVSAFAGDIVLSIFYIYLPLFAYELGASTLLVGIVGGADYLVYSIMPIFMGRISDQVRSRLTLLVISLGLIAVVSLLYVFTYDALTLGIIRIIEGVGWSILWPVIESGISEAAGKDSQRALGTYNYIWSAAAGLGPLVGAVLVFVVSIRDTFLFTSGMIVVGFLFIVLLPDASASKAVDKAEKEKKNNRIAGAQREDRFHARDFSKIIIPLMGKHAVLLLASVLVSLAVATLLTFFPPFAESIGISVLMIGVITFSFGASRFVSYVVLSMKGVRARAISIKYRNGFVLVAMFVASISGLFMTISAPGFLTYFLGFIFVGAAFAVVTTIAQVAMIAEAPVSQMGTGSGILESSIGTGSFLGPVLGGLVSGGSIVMPFYFPLACFLLFMLLVAGFAMSKRGK